MENSTWKLDEKANLEVGSQSGETRRYWEVS